MKDVLNQTNCGILINQDNSIDEIINAIYTMQKQADLFKNNIRQVKKNYTYEQNYELIDKIFANK